MMKSILAAALLFCMPAFAQSAPATAAKPAGVLKADEVQMLMPPSVFFSRQSATVQLRNSAGVRYPDGAITLAGLVDTGGYSTSIRDRYQFYVLTDAALEIAGKHVAPGAYGAGFVGGKLVLMDLSAATIFEAPLMHDAAFARPRPLQIVAGQGPEEFKLYLGRDYVMVHRAK